MTDCTRCKELAADLVKVIERSEHYVAEQLVRQMGSWEPTLSTKLVHGEAWFAELQAMYERAQATLKVLTDEPPSSNGLGRTVSTG